MSFTSTAVILDTETTGLPSEDGTPPEAVELAYRDLATRELFLRRYKPNNPMQWGAIAVHHILPLELLECPPSGQALLDAPLQHTYWIGHNIDYDWQVLGSPPAVRRICTLALSRSVWPQLDTHSQTAMVYFLQGANAGTRDWLRGAHSAERDIDSCELLFNAICDQLKPADLAALWELSEEARIPKIMTFGKFKGEPISKVDRGYASWYLKQTNTDPYVITAFRRAGLIR